MSICHLKPFLEFQIHMKRNEMPDMKTTVPNVVELPDQFFGEFSTDNNFVLVWCSVDAH